jgi:hypothetical protein
MIHPAQLLNDLKKLLAVLEQDLHARCAEVPEIDEKLRAEHAAAKEANRTAEPYETWRDGQLTQIAAAWILASVFVRFLEDNGLLPEPRLAGPGERLQRARDHHTLYFQQHRVHSDRDYLEHVFREVAALPAPAPLFDPRHNPLWQAGISGDGAARLLEFWQRIDPATGTLAHDFTDPEWGTRFLGDLYQDLSEAARKKYALLQTPEFVEEFVLDRTLAPAIDEFGYREVRLIDPTCGSGHFLLGAFHRLFALWAKDEPATNPRELAQRALDQVYGVDVNPYAAAIARFRLLLAALKASGITRLKDAPAFRVNVAAGDSLLHGPRFTETRGAQLSLDPRDTVRHVYLAEDRAELARILGRQYHVVVGNPPYITVKDKALNQAYRDRYGSCSGKYSLAVPFMERFFELALSSSSGAGMSAEASAQAGYAGMITANSFMKREFGKKLIEEYIPRWDLTHVIDTSGAYIPGHGTPTVILFGRHRRPVAGTVRAVMGIRGEPSTPDDPAKGLVWTAIVEQVDRPGSESEFVSVADAARDAFEKHPWSIGGGGAAELKDLLDEAAAATLDSIAESIGFASFTGQDEAFVADQQALRRAGIPEQLLRVFVYGEAVRDWAIVTEISAITPYAPDLSPVPYDAKARWGRYLWPLRTSLGSVISFGRKTRLELGDKWWTWYRWVPEKYRTPLSIAFAFVATHNHFVLDRGGKVFKQSAPVIKLPPDATEDDHLALLGLLNSSVACFWMKQNFFHKGVGGIGGGIGDEGWEPRYEFDGTKLKQFPTPAGRPLVLSREIDGLAQQLSDLLPNALAARAVPSRGTLDANRASAQQLRCQLINLQEELDWECYRLYELIDDDLTYAAHGGRGSVRAADGDTLPPLHLGERAFEIVMARKMAAGELETAWFERHGSAPLTEIPAHWPEDYREIVRRRIEAIETNPNIRLIEQPEYKRRWNTEPWESQLERALRSWLLDRLEDARYWPAVEVTTCAQLADRVRQDAEFMQVAELYRDRPDFDVGALVAELVESESVPFLPVLRYKPTGLRKRELWEKTWDLQRREDAAARAGDGAGPITPNPLLSEIPVPPKYTSADFQSGPYWRLRGKLDVPKERFISYPHCERTGDPTLVIGWAGWDHLQQAQALAGYYVRMKEREGWTGERLTPLLAGLLELQPWLDQWHNDIDPGYGVRHGRALPRLRLRRSPRAGADARSDPRLGPGSEEEGGNEACDRKAAPGEARSGAGRRNLAPRRQGAKLGFGTVNREAGNDLAIFAALREE